MKKASIVSIGNELLNGQTIDTNTTYLSGELLSIGIPVVSSFTIGDDVDAIVRTFNLAVADADIVMVTGGLGPTDDDLTRQAFAGYLGTELQLQADLLDRLENYFKKRNLQMSEKNKIQAYIPTGTKPIENSLGTAPGIMAQVKGKLIFAFPGVPSEMKRMFAVSVFPELQQFSGEQAVVVRKLRCFGAGESKIAELLGDACQRGRNPLVNCTVEYGIITLHIIATSRNKDTARQMVEKEEKTIRNTLGELVYGTAEQSLAEVVGEKLARQGKTIAVAESCTGGIVAGLLTDIPGASKYFTHGWITYSNAAKIRELAVAADLIEKYGAVSEQVAQAMAFNARNKARTDYAIGITGIAGPDGGTEQKPVGVVYISVDFDNGCDTKRCIFSHGRRSIRFRAAQTSLNMLRLRLNI
ncbi:MAG: competence/damage-inducible protein A [Planctomycetes bacterium]|nr:competence/damage-inducible protein A [Planctomycetota bacterium]MBL7143323.1 competence/damage-inducible protein A [Phycisphaerae bacterium]